MIYYKLSLFQYEKTMLKREYYSQFSKCHSEFASESQIADAETVTLNSFQGQHDNQHF